MKMRLNDVVMNKRPKLLTAHPIDRDHEIILEDLTILLAIYNDASFFHGLTPTNKEYEECERIELTYPSPKWSPNSKLYAKEETKCVDKEGYGCKFKGTQRASSMVQDD
jgi:hypothetical protein